MSLVGQYKNSVNYQKNHDKKKAIHRGFHDSFAKPEVMLRKLTHPRHEYCSGHFFMATFIFTTEKPIGIAANMNEKLRNGALVGGLDFSPNRK